MNTSDLPYSISNIAARLRAAREAIGLSQTEISRRLGASPSKWHNWESGRARINIDEALKLKRQFGITLDWVYHGDERGMPFELMQRMQSLAGGAKTIQ